MADFLTAVKSVRERGNDQNYDSDLKVVKSQATKRDDYDQEISKLVAESRGIRKDAPSSSPQPIESPEDVLQVLKSKPGLEQLLTALKSLHSNAYAPNFSIHVPGPLQSQIINTLICNILPDFWPSLRGKYARDFILCLFNVAGFNATFARLRLLTSEHDSKRSVQSRDVQGIEDLLEVTELLFKGDNVVNHVFRNFLVSLPDKRKREMVWKDFVNLLGSGRVIATIAQANDRVYESNPDPRRSKTALRLANGSEYAVWLGRNIARLVELDDEYASQQVACILAKSLSLGYSNSLLQGLFGSVIPSVVPGKLKQQNIEAMFQQTPLSAIRPFTEHLLRWMSSMSHLDAEQLPHKSEYNRGSAGGFAALISLVAGASLRLHQALLHSLSDASFCSVLSMEVRRACLAVISSSPTATDDLQALLDKHMTTFNDVLFANHAPTLQQEAAAQMILMVAGYIHRQTPMALLMTARSSNHMQGVSNRLDSSNARARWLGMVAATAISSLVDKDGTKMSFGTEDMQTEEAHWYLELVWIDDRVGTLSDFSLLLQVQTGLRRPVKHTKKISDELPQLNGKPVFGPARPPAQTEVIGEKVTDILVSDNEAEDDDFKPYAKPDSDPEDSDEDATLVNRHKVKPPVYIRDLMSMLRDDKSHDRFQIGIKHAASLIRRKSGFGAEVKDHAEEIGVILCNLQDPFSTEDFDELKLQAMIAVLLSDVKTMAPWFSRQAFTGDYSIAQRCTILSALGLGGRELAGLKDADDLNPGLSNIDFPSKRLPPHLHNIYTIDATTTKRLDAASKDIEQALIKPLALQAADQSTAHLNAVKVRTFSSRMEVERTKRKPAPNALAKLFGEAFFFPLVNRYQQDLAAYSTSSVYSSVPFLLVTFLKTLALLLHASGPATAGLTEISGEFWDLLLSLRVAALRDISVLQAVLFSLLTLLEINGDKQRIVQEHPKQLMETQQWVDMVFERMGAGSGRSDSADEAKVQTLAAGVLVKTREVVEAYQKELVGFSMD